jgi:hypothetical protein
MGKDDRPEGILILRNKMKIDAKILYGHDNGGYFLESAPEGVLCPQCGTCLDYAYAPDTLWSDERLKKYDVSYTYDSRMIVSEKFIDVNNMHGNSDLFIKALNTSPVLYYIYLNRIIQFDFEKRKTAFEKPCSKCGGFESVTGATPAYLKGGGLPGRGFFRTDLAFGSGRGKFPLIIVDSETARSFKTQRITGFVLKPVVFEE